MKKVAYFDVEYANSKNKSICQIGLMCEDFGTGEPYYPEMNIYINPEDGFDDFCIRIHGITFDKVKDKPTFPIVWNEIEKYFTNAIVIGHNVASADLDALVKNLKRYNLDIPEFYYICTLNLAKEFIPRYAVANYSMTSLCNFFGIDIDSEHDAFDDACANADLFKALIENYQIDIEKHIDKYFPKQTEGYIQYVSDPVLRKSISDFYGIIRGFSFDSKIDDAEKDYIVKWRNENIKYLNNKEIADIINVIDRIRSDNIITVDELTEIQSVIKKYLDIVSTSPITLATQILNGIMRGIITDGVITEAECRSLRQWLYDNVYLTGHYPFDKMMNLIEETLADGIITPDESSYITSIIHELLDPVESLKSQVNTIEGKRICLSGNFAFGQKADVENYIIEHNGLIDSSVKKTTDILLIGDCECQAYSNGKYGTKVIKALEYNNKGCNIQILKESDFFTNIKRERR